MTYFQNLYNQPSVFFFHGAVGARLAGLSYGEAKQTAENLKASVEATYRTLQPSQVSLTYSMVGFGEALGSRLEYFDQHAPLIRDYRLNTLAEGLDIDYSAVRLEHDPYLQKLYEACRSIEVPVPLTFDLVGPLTALSSMIEAEKILRAMRREPELLEAVLSHISHALVGIVDDLASLSSLQFSISEPMASGDLISPKQFERFALPGLEKVVSRIKEHERSSYLHICGNTKPHLSLIADTGIDALSLDQKMNLRQTKEIIGKRLTLIGNIDPVRIIRDTNSSRIQEAVQDAYRDAGDSPMGFVIAPGCSVPFDTPVENCHAFMKYAYKYSQ